MQRSQTGEGKKTIEQSTISEIEEKVTIERTLLRSTISEIEEKMTNERTLLLLLLFVRLSLLSPLFSFQQLLFNLWWKFRSPRRRIVRSNRLSEDIRLALVGKVETYLGVVSFECVEVGSG